MLKFPWSKNKPKIEFFNLSPEIARIMPIVPSYEYKPAWWYKCGAEYRRLKRDPEWQNSPNVHTARCPGIHQVLGHGWVMRCYQDFTITTFNEGDPELEPDDDYRSKFKWLVSQNIGSDDRSELDPLISYHHPSQYADYFQEWDTTWLKCTLKIQMNWRAIIPPGYMLLEMPYPYPDHHQFFARQGVYYPEYGTANLNLQILWRRDGRTVLVPAGTPLALYYCIPKKDVDFEVREATEEDRILSSASTLAYNSTLGKTAGSAYMRKTKIFKP